VRHLSRVFAAALLTVAFCAHATGQRVALVIGNAGYKDAPLANPLNDARAMAHALRDSGFTVITRENADQKGMVAALREFGDKLRGGGTGIFYFAGHGMQIKGRNYLMPVGISVEREDEVAYAGVDAQAVLDKMEAAGNGMNIMILDACRNNPFARAFRSASTGLAPMDAPVGTLVAFATSPGNVASDGAGANGLYTQHLLAAMRAEGAKVEDVFKRVRAGVRRDSGGKQIPWEATSLEGDFYFHPLQHAAVQSAPAAAAPSQPVRLPPVATAPAPPAATALAADPLFEDALWMSIKDSGEPAELRAFLEWYPAGKFASQARAQMAALEDRARPPAGGVAAAVAAPPRPQAGPSGPRSNARGFTVGDRWRYQAVDKYKGEVVFNWSYKVDRILDNGDMEWNGDAIRTAPDGNFRRDNNTRFPLQEFGAHWQMIPSVLKPGTAEKVSHVRTFRRDDGFEGRVEVAGSLTVKAVETVKVPAGEFETLRIEREVTESGRQTNGNATWFARSTIITWYSTGMRAVVARETEYRMGGGGAPDRRRIELTSYEVSDFRTASR
jgi:hypothetical protein